MKIYTEYKEVTFILNFSMADAVMVGTSFNHNLVCVGKDTTIRHLKNIFDMILKECKY